jgi:L-alanine-DL-glutamate epimerase-like enolase superfamily enzyme
MAAAAGPRLERAPWARPNTAVAVAASNTLLFELKPVPSPMQHELVRNPIGQTDGWVTAPEGPGLGVEVDESAVRRYQFREDALGR